VEISRSVINRMSNMVKSSNIEEGGKLIGYYTKLNDQINLKVLSYIDSGPNVNNSFTHIFPNGNYQEALFRTIEAHDPNIEHLGSWHSHHCNGFDQLSQGDIEGYIKNVNNKSYNLDYFFVILVTGIHKNNLVLKYFLFIRNSNSYYPLDDTNITFNNIKYIYDEMIIVSEKFAFNNRKISIRQSKVLSQKPKIEISENEVLRKVRKEDNDWLLLHYPNLSIFQNKTTSAIGWQWSILIINNKSISVKYIHPTKIRKLTKGFALLETAHSGKIISSQKVALDEKRHSKIQNYLIHAIQSFWRIQKSNPLV